LTHLGHGHCGAKGPAFKAMSCELLAKAESHRRGKVGSVRLAAQKNGNPGANAVSGGSARRLGFTDVAVCLFGNGALGRRLLHDVVNIAALWKLPVINVARTASIAQTRGLEKW
jgi:acetoin:2,6-dichlorophenolindophenol oxidoreductase subunit alpha